MPNAYLCYHDASNETGERLGQYLGVDNGTDVPQTGYDTLIRWGSRVTASGLTSFNTVINPRDAIRNASQKYDALQRLDDAGVRVPRHTRDRDELGPHHSDEITYPALGRADSHTRGTDIELILQWRDAYLTDNDHFVDYIPTKMEYRMHVVDGDVIKVHEKRQRHEADNHAYIRNHETGYVFLDPRDDEPDHDLATDAIDAMGLDIGAVDVIRAEETHEEYVLEVNTAPSLDEPNLRRYGDAIAEMADLDSIDGLNAVDWDDDDTDDSGDG